MKSSEVAAHWEANAPAWIELSRAGYDVYRDTHNNPAFLAFLPSVNGLRGLDIGCGEGTNTSILAELGAGMTGVDIAPSFIKAAQELVKERGLGIDVQLGDATDLQFPNSSFDFATAFMSMMDMPDQEKAFSQVFRVVKPGGFFQFSILHPCFVPPMRKVVRNDAGDVLAIQVSDYFRRTSGEIETWRFNNAPQEINERHAPFTVPRFHRTLSDWISLSVASGFQIEAVQEPMADAETARKVPKVAHTRVAPIFLHFRLRKPDRA